MRRYLPFLLLSLAIPLLLFSRCRHFEFVTLDDGVVVAHNPLVNPPTAQHLADIWRRPHDGLYVPLTYTAWYVVAWLEHKTPGQTLDPGPFHVLNVSLHALNSALVFLILSLILEAPLPALVGAIFFGVHPLHVEPVAWIAGLKDILFAFFSLLALLFALLGTKRNRPTLARPALLCFVLALLSKPAAVTLPLLLVTLEVFWLGVPLKTSVKRWSFWFLLVIPIALITKAEQPDKYVITLVPWLSRPLIAADALAFYLAKLFVPVGLTVNYGRTPARVLAQSLTPWLLLLPPLAVALLLRRERRRYLGALALLVLSCLPELGFIPFAFQNYSTVADRFVYLGLLGPALALAILSEHPVRRATAFGALGLLALLSLGQTRAWEDNRAMLYQVLAANPDDPDNHYALARMLAEESDPPGSPDRFLKFLRVRRRRTDPAFRNAVFREAVEQFEETLRLSPRNAMAHSELALLLARHGLRQEAMAHLERALEIEPKLPGGANNLGVWNAESGNLKAAIDWFRRAVRMAPHDPGAGRNLATALRRAGLPQ